MCALQAQQSGGELCRPPNSSSKQRRCLFLLCGANSAAAFLMTSGANFLHFCPLIMFLPKSRSLFLKQKRALPVNNLKQTVWINVPSSQKQTYLSVTSLFLWLPCASKHWLSNLPAICRARSKCALLRMWQVPHCGHKSACGRERARD